MKFTEPTIRALARVLLLILARDASERQVSLALRLLRETEAGKS